MKAIDITATDFTAQTAVELRKLAADMGIKGASKGRKADLVAALRVIQNEQIERAAKVEASKRNADVKRDRTGWTTHCTECSRKLKGQEFGGLCEADRSYGEWENSHADENHADQQVVEDCPVCHPELDPRKPVAKREGRSRAGMVIVAKGSEIHKSQIFKEAAEAAGWIVTVTGEVYDDEKATRYYADAYRGTDAIQLAWDGRAYDYPASSALIAGKNRKVRNLKEALRLLAA